MSVPLSLRFGFSITQRTAALDSLKSEHGSSERQRGGS